MAKPESVTSISHLPNMKTIGIQSLVAYRPRNNRPRQRYARDTNYSLVHRLMNAERTMNKAEREADFQTFLHPKPSWQALESLALISLRAAS